MKNRFLLLLIPFILFSCKKDDETEQHDYNADYTIVTGQDAFLNGKSAVVKGKIRLSSGKIKNYGHCWSEYQNPTVENDFKTSLGSCDESREFFSQMDQLKVSTSYFVRAYAQDANGTTYGNEVAIRTTDINVTNVQVVSTTSTSANMEATIEVTTVPPGKYGFCWATHNNPTVDDHNVVSHQYSGGKISATLWNLPSDKTIYIRAYGFLGFMAYSKVFELTLSPVVLKPLEIYPKSDTSLRIKTTFDINTTIKDHGICWAVNTLPTINHDKKSLGANAGQGVTSCLIKGLSVDSNYMFRSYVIAQNDSVYYSNANSTVLETNIQIELFNCKQQDNNTVVARSSFSANCFIKDYGLCWATTNPVPQISDNIVSLGDELVEGTQEINVTMPHQDNPCFIRTYIIDRYNKVHYSQRKHLNFTYPITIPDYPSYKKKASVKFDINGELYYGLCRDDASAALYHLDQETLSWSLKSNFPEPSLLEGEYNTTHSATKDGHVFCLKGGLVIMYRYMPETNSWNKLGEYDVSSLSIVYISSLRVNNDNYVLLTPDYNKAIRLYKVSDNSWELIKIIPKAGYHQLSFAIDNNLYITKKEKLFYINLDNLLFSSYYSKPSLTSTSYKENWSHYFQHKGNIYWSAGNKIYKFMFDNNNWFPCTDFSKFSDESTSVIINNKVFIGIGCIPGKSFTRYKSLK